MPPTLLLIDALNLIRRIYAAVPASDGALIDATTHHSADSESRVEGAIAATRSSLLRALHDCQPSHALMVFDGDPPTWRHQLYPDYKANRKPMPHSLRNRLMDFNQLTRSMGVMTFRRNGVEADDVIAATAYKGAKAGLNTIILSTDRAYQQLLIHPQIRLRDHFQKQETGIKEAEKQHGIAVGQLLDYWALAGVGDVPGVSGIGKKGALGLIEEYGSLDQIMVRVESGSESVEGRLKGGLKGGLKSAMGKLTRQREQARLSKQLVTLRTDIDLGLSLKDMRYQPAQRSSNPPGRSLP